MKMILEGYLYCVLSHDTSYFVITKKRVPVEMLVNLCGKELSKKEIKILKEFLHVGQIDEELWQAIETTIQSKCIEDVLDIVKGKRVRITIEVLE